MNTMKNAEIDYDLESGFVWALDDEGKQLFQACLESRVDGKGAKKELSRSDCGWDWGMCGDANFDAGADYLVAADFFTKIRKNGFRVIP